MRAIHLNIISLVIRWDKVTCDVLGSYLCHAVHIHVHVLYENVLMMLRDSATLFLSLRIIFTLEFYN